MNYNVKNETQNYLNWRLLSGQSFGSFGQAATRKLHLRHIIKLLENRNIADIHNTYAAFQACLLLRYYNYQ